MPADFKVKLKKLILYPKQNTIKKQLLSAFAKRSLSFVKNPAVPPAIQLKPAVSRWVIAQVLYKSPAKNDAAPDKIGRGHLRHTRRWFPVELMLV